MTRFVIVNDAQVAEWARSLAAICMKRGREAEAEEYSQWFYVLPSEDPHTYGSLAEATEIRDATREEYDNHEINVYRLITDDAYSELLAACEAVLDVLDDACACSLCGPCTIHAPRLRAAIKATE